MDLAGLDMYVGGIWELMIINSDNTRGRGRPKLTFDVIVKNDMIKLNLSEYLAFNRV